LLYELKNRGKKIHSKGRCQKKRENNGVFDTCPDPSQPGRGMGNFFLNNRNSLSLGIEIYFVYNQFCFFELLIINK
jgi:hypothetical protein